MIRNQKTLAAEGWWRGEGGEGGGEGGWRNSLSDLGYLRRSWSGSAHGAGVSCQYRVVVALTAGPHTADVIQACPGQLLLLVVLVQRDGEGERKRETRVLGCTSERGGPPGNPHHKDQLMISIYSIIHDPSPPTLLLPPSSYYYCSLLVLSIPPSPTAPPHHRLLLPSSSFSCPPSISALGLKPSI